MGVVSCTGGSPGGGVLRLPRSWLPALALAAQAADFGEGFFLFALVILPVVLFVGVATVVRLGSSNYHDAQCVIGMNRIRGAYLELAPDLEKYFVMSANDDVRGVGVTMALPPGGQSLLHVLAATPSVIGVVNSVVAAVIVALVAVQLAAANIVTLIAGVAAFVASMALHAAYGRAQIIRGQTGVRPLFPSRPADPHD